ncbi:uroporphyrinogen-III C-methyltransferase [Roseiterribacter gracilis]|uniref:uroporphyrinogen-III C-methyltransferase n=1 Tax=Roseiterribacter gracilis TaxID=2812848 RepID=A0A8S8XEU7_9PROT|nr:uroporphyrin-III C-methyltransferase [Rhodospirillales bacterium TMPK1]
MHSLAHSTTLPQLEAGSVWLVGAGPGDPGLLTLHAVGAIRAADLVLYDALINTEILSEARRNARLVCVGRRKGNAPTTQDEIARLMIEGARDGLRVVRLKGGDPCMFGRGGEEAAALRDAGIPFRIVPGVTAGIGGLAYAGIAATHRDANAAVTFLTGHQTGGALPGDLDWDALARSDNALVVYMGVSALDRVVPALLSHGRDAATPVAIVAHATTPSQRVLNTTLGEAVLAARRAKIDAPALIVIGRIADPALATPWFEPQQDEHAARITDRSLLAAFTA